MTVREDSENGPLTAGGRPGSAAPNIPVIYGAPAPRGTRAGQAGRPGRPWAAPLAIALAAVGAICLGALAGLVAVLLHDRPVPVATPPLPSVFRLHAGDCVNSPQNAASGAHVVPCARPHNAEIFAAFRLAGHRWPGTAAVGTRARLGCLSRLGSYLNPQLATATLAESYIYPSAGAWDVGERTVICEVRSTQGKLTGSVRGLS